MGHSWLFRTRIHLINKCAVVLTYQYPSLIRESFSLWPKHFSHSSKWEVDWGKVFFFFFFIWRVGCASSDFPPRVLNLSWDNLEVAVLRLQAFSLSYQGLALLTCTPYTHTHAYAGAPHRFAVDLPDCIGPLTFHQVPSALASLGWSSESSVQPGSQNVTVFSADHTTQGYWHGEICITVRNSEHLQFLMDNIQVLCSSEVQ